MRYVAVGDIHGQRGKLQQLMYNISQVDDLRDATYVFLGDYVDGGPDTKGVVNELMAYERQNGHWVFLKGNHEDMMLDALVYGSRRYGDYYQWYSQGGRETAQSYFPQGIDPFQRALMKPLDYIPREHIDWLDARPLHYVTKNFIFVHAGLLPGATVETTPDIDKLWIRSKFFNSDHDWGRRVIFGHTAFDEPLIKPNMIGIDTMFHGYGHITAVILDDNAPQEQIIVTSETEAEGRVRRVMEEADE